MTSEAKTVPLWINGQAVKSANTFTVRSAQKQQDVGLAYSADVKIAREAVDVAKEAFESWKLTSATHRRDLIFRVAALYRQRMEELVQVQMEETSCQESWARMNVGHAAGIIEEIASRVTSVSGEIPQVASHKSMALVFKEPIGPVLVIAPWNASLILSTRAISTPLGVGCSVVFKASELCPRTHHKIREIFAEAGLPNGLLNVIQTRREDAGEVTEALIAHPAIRKIEFIGSKSVGKIIGQVASKYLKPVLMELGGKSAAIVLDDADLEKAADMCIKGAFVHHGQICFSTERIIVEEKVADAFIKILKENGPKFKPGFGVTVGMARNANRKLLDAQSKGASFLFGGPDPEEKFTDTIPDAASMRPTIVTGVTKEMEIWDDESFGPSASLFIVKDDAEAIALANNSSYGLNAAVHTTNMERGIDVARQIEVGQVHINNMTEYDEPTLPVGGEKMSGWGRSNAKWGIEEFLSHRLVTINMKEPLKFIQ